MGIIIFGSFKIITIMVVENPSFVVKNHKFRYLFIITGVVLILLVSFLDYFDTKRLGLSREVYVLSAVIIFVIIGVFRYLKDYHYIHFLIQNDKLSLKFYSLRSFSGKRKNIEIPLALLVKYEITKRYLGLATYLVLYQQIKGKVAKYPPVSLSALNKEDIKKITSILDNLLNLKN